MPLPEVKTTVELIVTQAGVQTAKVTVEIEAGVAFADVINLLTTQVAEALGIGG